MTHASQLCAGVVNPTFTGVACACSLLRLRLVRDFPDVVQQVLLLQWILFCRPKHQKLLRRYPCLLWPSPYQCRVLQNYRWFCWCPKTASSLLVSLQSFSKASSLSRTPVPSPAVHGWRLGEGISSRRTSHSCAEAIGSSSCGQSAPNGGNSNLLSQLSPKLYSGDR